MLKAPLIGVWCVVCGVLYVLCADACFCVLLCAAVFDVLCADCDV